MIGRPSSRHVEVYVFRRRGKRAAFLCLRRAKNRSLPGVWQPVTGKRRRREPAVIAAWRETTEEIGLKPIRMWSLEHVTVYFDPAADQFQMLPLFAAEIPWTARIRLSPEHDAFRFASAGPAGRMYLWSAQRQGLAAVQREVLARPRLASALEVPRPRMRRA
jgi:8-oxo-dGTP pyrophosphatase MutT (NUDIX family)